jgi:hypothetical protein
MMSQRSKTPRFQNAGSRFPDFSTRSPWLQNRRCGTQGISTRFKLCNNFA